MNQNSLDLGIVKNDLIINDVKGTANSTSPEKRVKSVGDNTTQNRIDYEDVNHKTISSLYKNLQNTVGKFLKIGSEDYLLELMIASAISTELSKPIWLMIQAPSSSGKSEYLSLLASVNAIELFDITGRTLFSAHSDSKGGVIPSQIKDKGILVIPDFTTVLSASSNERKSIFNHLRIAYDGTASRIGGISSNNTKPWRGKLSCIVGVTNAIESFKDKSSDLGERFIYYRHNAPELDYKEISSYISLDSTKPKKEAGVSFRKLAKQGRKIVKLVKLNDNEEQYLFNCAELISLFRTVIQRDNRSREIQEIHSPEKPFRLFKQLSNMLISLKAIDGLSDKRGYNILREITFSSLPEKRLKVFELLSDTTYSESSRIANQFKENRNVIYRVLEDLEALELIEKQLNNANHQWKRTESANELYSKILVP